MAYCLPLINYIHVFFLTLRYTQRWVRFCLHSCLPAYTWISAKAVSPTIQAAACWLQNLILPLQIQTTTAERSGVMNRGFYTELLVTGSQAFDLTVSWSVKWWTSSTVLDRAVVTEYMHSLIHYIHWLTGVVKVNSWTMSSKRSLLPGRSTTKVKDCGSASKSYLVTSSRSVSFVARICQHSVVSWFTVLLYRFVRWHSSSSLWAELD